ncbi:MAG TPA: RNA methyltransferase [Gammaproteobacteria bacterium]|nr:RNA methyltransferase [Gammaproteobacteria bacterium]
MKNVMQRLRAIRVVLVEPSHPGNVGAAARAMKTMGLGELALVAPQRFPHAEATALASGAADILQDAAVYETLEAAVADCTLVVGSSARARRLAVPPHDARTAALRVAGLAPQERPAIVFGRERTGLTNAELDRCHWLMQIPANPAYSSLNLAAAVQVVCYELRMAMSADGATASGEAPAPAGDMERFYEHLERVLVATGFLDPQAPKLLMRRLRRLFQRARPDRNEVNILRGILTSVERLRQR